MVTTSYKQDIKQKKAHLGLVGGLWPRMTSHRWGFPSHHDANKNIALARLFRVYIGCNPIAIVNIVIDRVVL